MADFCKQCSIDNFGEDFQELAHLIKPEQPLPAGMGISALCEGCGLTFVDNDGRCIAPYCLERHGMYEWLVRVPEAEFVHRIVHPLNCKHPDGQVTLPFLDDGPPNKVTFAELLKNYGGNADRIIWRSFRIRREVNGRTTPAPT